MFRHLFVERCPAAVAREKQQQRRERRSRPSELERQLQPLQLVLEFAHRRALRLRGGWLHLFLSPEVLQRRHEVGRVCDVRFRQSDDELPRRGRRTGIVRNAFEHVPIFWQRSELRQRVHVLPIVVFRRPRVAGADVALDRYRGTEASADRAGERRGRPARERRVDNRRALPVADENRCVVLRQLQRLLRRVRHDLEVRRDVPAAAFSSRGAFQRWIADADDDRLHRDLARDAHHRRVPAGRAAHEQDHMRRRRARHVSHARAGARKRDPLFVPAALRCWWALSRRDGGPIAARIRQVVRDLPEAASMIPIMHEAATTRVRMATAILEASEEEAVPTTAGRPLPAVYCVAAGVLNSVSTASENVSISSSVV